MDAVMETMDDDTPAVLDVDLESKHASYKDMLIIAKDLSDQARTSKGSPEKKNKEIKERAKL